MTKLEERIFRYFRDEYGYGDDEPIADEPLKYFIDSLGILKLISFLESEFAVRLDIEALTAENFGTPALVARYVESRTASSAPAP